MNIQKIKIICEEAYAESIWCKRLLGGFVKELKKRRLSYEVLPHLDVVAEDEMVCLIGMSSSWCEEHIKRCNFLGCTPLALSSQSHRVTTGNFHFLCPDIRTAAKELKEKLDKAGRTSVALYGANISAELDRDRTEILSLLVQDTSAIIPNTGNLENCFRSFLPKASQYDVVICANGYAAISLVKKLEKENKELLDKLVVISFEEVLKHSKYNQWISLVDLKLESYGKTAFAMLELIDSGNTISTVTVEMQCSVCDILSKDSLEEAETLEENYLLYEDPEIIHMAKIEQLFRDADDMDHHIIAMLLDNAKYGEIADSCYMTEGNVKYRVKKYMSICDCKTKKELLELLQEYLQ